MAALMTNLFVGVKAPPPPRRMNGWLGIPGGSGHREPQVFQTNAGMPCGNKRERVCGLISVMSSEVSDTVQLTGFAFGV